MASTAPLESLYTLENAVKFDWRSVNGRLHHERVAHLKKYLVGKKILDAGCGGGAYVDFLSRAGFDATGVDNHTQFLAVAGAGHFQGTFVEGDLTDLPFPDKTFETTYCFDVLEHVDDVRALEQLERVTSRRILVAVPREDDVMNKYSLTFFHYQDKTHLRNYTEESLGRLLSAVPHKNVQIEREIPVNLKRLVPDLVKAHSSHWFLKPVYRRLFDFLLTRASYETVYTGLVGIVDL
jgi:SAM-dependent methyltransferase